jgi:hypothetical protein
MGPMWFELSAAKGNGCSPSELCDGQAINALKRWINQVPSLDRNGHFVKFV